MGFIVLTATTLFSIFFCILSYLLILLLIINIYLVLLKERATGYLSSSCNFSIKCFLQYFVIYYLILLFIILRFLHCDVCTLFFGQLIFTPFNLKILYIFLIWSLFIFYIYMQWHAMLSNVLLYTFITYLLTIVCWSLWLCSSLFTIIFLFDTLNLTLYLFFFNSINKRYLKINDQAWVGGFLGGFTIFFWMSFLSTILFLLFCYYIYSTFHTFNIYLLNVNFFFLLISSTIQEIIRICLYFIFLIVFIALKLGIAPFFLWKFSFFQNLNFLTLFIYLFGYYFFISLFFFFNFYNYFMFAYFFFKWYIYFYMVVSIFFILIKFNKINSIYTFYIYSSLLNLNLILLVLFTASQQLFVLL